jgi:LmbE family N-acetylglucosaminyl deacetylase
MRVLAIGAHPDDIELGCAGTLIKHRENSDELFLLILTKGEASGDAKTREKECFASAKLLDVKDLFFGGLRDTRVDDGFETIMEIEKIITQASPEIIYTHSVKDTHQDHRNTGYATLSAARRCKKILMYESPTTFQEFSPHVFIDIKSQFERKKEIMHLFKSQSNKQWWSMGRRAALALEGLASYRGFQAGLEVAEAFEMVRLVITGDEPILPSKRS